MQTCELAAVLHCRLTEEVAAARLQLTQYASEMQKLAEEERRNSEQLQIANNKLREYALELQALVDNERRHSEEIQQAYFETVRLLTMASSFRDNETGAHIQRIGEYARVLALEAGQSEQEAELMAAAAPMHDLGKIGIPDRILRKQGPLSEEEWMEMKQHPLIGASLLEGSRSPLLELARSIALAHHERWNGTGYPYGLAGKEIAFAARVVAIGDTYDALRSTRPYKQGFSHERSCGIMLQGDGRTSPKHFDPELLALFQRAQKKFACIFEAIPDTGGGGRLRWNRNLTPPRSKTGFLA
jgi:putative two-component system response regulator